MGLHHIKRNKNDQTSTQLRFYLFKLPFCLRKGACYISLSLSDKNNIQTLQTSDYYEYIKELLHFLCIKSKTLKYFYCNFFKNFYKQITIRMAEK